MHTLLYGGGIKKVTRKHNFFKLETIYKKTRKTMKNTNVSSGYPKFEYRVVWEGRKWGKPLVVAQTLRNGVATDKYEVMEKWLYLQLENQKATEEAFWDSVNITETRKMLKSYGKDNK